MELSCLLLTASKSLGNDFRFLPEIIKAIIVAAFDFIFFFHFEAISSSSINCRRSLLQDVVSLALIHKPI